jgi:hypothetical protein
VFVCAFLLFWGYCEWWEARQPRRPTPNAQALDGREVYVVEGAADDTFNGIYMQAGEHDGRPCYAKSPPTRYLWQGPDAWHLSTEAGMPADGYIGQPGKAAVCGWSEDGSPAPCPRVTVVPEVPVDPPVNPRASL